MNTLMVSGTSGVSSQQKRVQILYGTVQVLEQNEKKF